MYRATVGSNARLTKRLSVSGAVGGVLLDPADDGPTADVIFNVGADYKLKTCFFTHSLRGGILCQARMVNSMIRFLRGVGVSHQVANDLLTLGLSSSYVLPEG